MELPQWASDEVTIARPGRKASRGTQVDDWDNSRKHTISGCSVQPTSTESGTDTSAGAQSVDAVLFAPPEADIQIGDRVTWQGHDCAIVGVPISRHSPLGSFGHTKVYLTSRGTWRR